MTTPVEELAAAVRSGDRAALPKAITFAPGAQYGVPRAIAHQRSRRFYERALELFAAAGEECNERFGVSQLPWVFERLWPAIWLNEPASPFIPARPELVAA